MEDARLFSMMNDIYIATTQEFTSNEAFNTFSMGTSFTNQKSKFITDLIGQHKHHANISANKREFAANFLMLGHDYGNLSYRWIPSYHQAKAATFEEALSQLQEYHYTMVKLPGYKGAWNWENDVLVEVFEQLGLDLP